MQTKEHSMKQVHDVNGRGPSLLTVNGKVYDVVSFLDIHPGGPDLIAEYLNGKDVGRLMEGLDDPSAHEHSRAAMTMLEQFLVINENTGKRVEETRTSDKTFQIDPTKPLIPQVGYLGKDYEEWVHTPDLTIKNQRLFHSDFMESISRNNWWTVPIVWGPLAVWSEMRALKFGLSPVMMLSCMLLGYWIWSITEYFLHRFLFHMKADTYWTATAHYFIHGLHHKYPLDFKRLIFPPPFSSPVIYLLWWVSKVVFPNAVSQSVFGGGLVGYIFYDVQHYFLHFGNAFTEGLRDMKRYHLNHHFKVHTDGFGVTTKLWDWVFGTLPATSGSKVSKKLHDRK
ncbi:hypothetical protein R1sor_014937 [Riccia sorocarpa]|uniref:Fatty acid 2-hydroxylase n=1 Tax=Riccia sorocarpa TaxID=122646 RepID=A0ABD3HBA3_9MARC